MGWCCFAMLREAQLWATLINCIWHRCGRYLAMLWFTPVGEKKQTGARFHSLVKVGRMLFVWAKANLPSGSGNTVLEFGNIDRQHFTGEIWAFQFSFLILNLVCECIQINYSHYSLHSSSAQNQTALPSLSHRWPLSYTHQCSIMPSSEA